MKQILILIMCGFLAACAPVALKPVQHPKRAWMAHRAVLSQLSCFTLKGAIGVSAKGQASSANVIWQQNKANYKIEFYGPLGIGASTLTGGSGVVRFVTPRGAQTANNPELLLDSELGWSVPVEGLVDWIRGLPQLASSKYELNHFGYISNLTENDWQIRYLNYMNIGGLGLPQQMILTRGKLRVVISIDNWQKSC